MTRQTKTEKQRAEEALGIAERRHSRAAAAVRRLNDDLRSAELELETARELRDFLRKHPALQNTTTPKETTTP